jgi:hypothetical protein
MSKKTENKIHETKGNIFAGLGLDDAEERREGRSSQPRGHPARHTRLSHQP